MGRSSSTAGEVRGDGTTRDNDANLAVPARNRVGAGNHQDQFKISETDLETLTR